MSYGLVGQKCGMTRIFTPEGVAIPVSVILISPNRVTQIKTNETDRYQALQITFGSKKPSKVTKPMAGHFAKANVKAGQVVREIGFSEAGNINVGDELTVDMLFEEGQKVDVTGTSKGKGFAGAIKRHNFKSQRASHGNSLSHRAPGSIGQRQTPGRVFKNKKMAGHLGDEQVTIQSLKIVKVDKERNLLILKGAIPGAPGELVFVKAAIKEKGAS